jgi:pimeloyl-ACP methyl ester carboxylesterase
VKEPLRYTSFEQTPIAFQFIRPENGKEALVLVFLHHALGSIAQWKDFPLALAERTRLPALLIDRQGHGRSGPFDGPRDAHYLRREALEVLPALLRELGIEKPFLVGHSDGATIALLYAAHFPVAGLIAEAPHIDVESHSLNGIRQAVKGRDELIRRLRKYHGDKAEALVAAWADTWLDPRFKDWTIEPELSGISCPVLVVQGLRDEYGTNHHLEAILKALGRKACAFLLDDTGHFPHVEAREAVLERMADFIRYSITHHITPLT